MAIPKTLILSATPPGTVGTGEALLREICLAFPEQTLCIFVLESLNYSLPGDTNDIKDLHIERVRLPDELVKPATKLPVLKELSEYAKRIEYWREVETIRRQAIEYGRKHECKQVLAVLGSPTVTVIAEAVALALKAELICLAWDPHETTMQLLHFDEGTKQRVMTHFASCMKRAKRLAVASDGMREEYKSRYGIEGIPLIRPVREAQIRKNRSIRFEDSNSHIVIGFSGSLYAKNEFAALFDALSSIGWKIEGKRVTFKVLSNYFFFPQDFQQKNSSIQLLGFRDQDSVVDELSKCHIAYLPYWFDESRSLSVRTCFPDKTVTYLASGVPIYFHGPEQSTPTDFFAKYPVGLACHSLAPAEILSVLTRLLTEEKFRDSAWEARNYALASEFSLPKFRQRIANLLAVSPSELNQLH